MRGNILILSEDAVFARMLELELVMMRFSVQIDPAPAAVRQADLILVDLDTASIPDKTAEGARIVGFTKRFEVSQIDAGRRCSMILHRPFEMRILREEVSLLDANAGEKENIKSHKKTGALVLNGNTLSFGEDTVILRPKEAAVMTCLISNRSKAVSREEICSVIGESSANKADVYICYLRRKLATLTDLPVIRTVRGKGYKIY